MRIRAGAVAYLNSRPLVYGLDRLFDVRFDAPSRCASLLHEGAIDVGLIPSIEYLSSGGHPGGGVRLQPDHPSYRVVPGAAIASRGAVASVALFTGRPVERIGSVALDTSSRTSAALLRVLCAEQFGIAPEFVEAPPDLGAMTKRCDAALLIGDAALFADHEARGLNKLDLGQAWTDMTGLPFVWAFWAGRVNALSADDIAALQRAREQGLAARDEIARAYAAGDAKKAARARHYLRENIRYDLGETEQDGLRRFYDSAARLGLVERAQEIVFY